MVLRQIALMTIFLYYCVVFIVLILASPLLIFKGKARAGLWQKLGMVPESFAVKSPSVWFHAVSVGEFNAIKTLLALFQAEHPDIPVVVSTTTRTGQALAQETVGSWAKVVYMPYDLPWSVSAWLERAKPSLVVIAETEIWPGLAYQCKRRGINLVVVNGRISPRSFKSYSRLRGFFASVLANFTAFGVQAESEAERYRALAAPKKIDVQILGNLKLDGLTAHDATTTEGLRHSTGVSSGDIVFIAGSTHEGEEAAVVDAFISAKKQFPNLKLIVAPRHPERFDRAYEIITRAGLTCARHSTGQKLDSGTDVLLVDAMGLLTKLYSISHVAFVGGTIAPIGGHNLMEPYLYNVPVICGPNIQKTRDTAAQLDHMGAIFIVPDAKVAPEKLISLLSNEQLRTEMGGKGNQFLLISRGATERALAFIDRFLLPSSSASKPDAVPASNESHKL
jgi:3-deoxy-D-manno-octulosonic-acid transferase